MGCNSGSEASIKFCQQQDIKTDADFIVFFHMTSHPRILKCI